MSRQRKQDKSDKKKEAPSGSVVSIKEAVRKEVRPKPDLPNRRHIETVVLEKAKLRESKLQNLLRSIGIGVTIMAALLVYDDGMTHLRIYQANNVIKADVTWMRQIDRAMLNLRMHENQARMKHQQEEYVNVKQLNIDRLLYQIKVAEAYAGANKIIGEDINRSAGLFNRFDESVPNILAKNAPSDSVWRYYLLRNEFLIGLKIQEQKAIIKYEQKFVLMRFFDNIKYWSGRVF